MLLDIPTNGDGNPNVIHVLGSVSNINEDDIRDIDLFYNNLCVDLCDALNLNILEIKKHCFEPAGFSLLALLSESHMSFHSWPERKAVFFDLFSCSDLNVGLISVIIAGYFKQSGLPNAVVKMQGFHRSHEHHIETEDQVFYTTENGLTPFNHG